jgi:LmbE family N-acetylglucosaminyl deacetylase
MLSLPIKSPSGGPLSVLAIGAHPDDIEIGAGGLLLGLAESKLRARYVVLTGTAERQQEARDAAHSFLPGADLSIEFFDLPEGRLPAAWGSVKEILEGVARSCSPDVIIAPSSDDAHQDHRTIGEFVPTVAKSNCCTSAFRRSGAATGGTTRSSSAWLDCATWNAERVTLRRSGAQRQ